MQSKNPFVDDLAKLMRTAVGMAEGAKEEFETVFSSIVDRWLSERNLVTREELDVLNQRLEDIQKELQEFKKSKKRTRKSS